LSRSNPRPSHRGVRPPHLPNLETVLTSAALFAGSSRPRYYNTLTSTMSKSPSSCLGMLCSLQSGPSLTALSTATNSPKSSSYLSSSSTFVSQNDNKIQISKPLCSCNPPCASECHHSAYARPLGDTSRRLCDTPATSCSYIAFSKKTSPEDLLSLLTNAPLNLLQKWSSHLAAKVAGCRNAQTSFSIPLFAHFWS
jgi:hypothetical protein